MIIYDDSTPLVRLFPDTGAQNNNINIIIITRARPLFFASVSSYFLFVVMVWPSTRQKPLQTLLCPYNTFLAFHEEYNNIILLLRSSQ